MATLEGVIGVAAWIGSICLPVVLAVWCWGKARRSPRGWLIDLLVGPTLLALEWLLIDAIFWAANDTGDGPPGLGLAIVPSVLIVAGTALTYYTIFAVRGFGGLARTLRAGARTR